MKNKFIELSLKSIEWNKAKLPNNTLEMQIKKVGEEFNEFINTSDKEDGMKELADIFIAIAGIGRFSIEKYFAGLLSFFAELNRTQIDLTLLEEEVEKKLKSINNLNYVVVDGVYRHSRLN